MPKVKIARKSTLVDMTPMSDVAFLLVTFFMLTTKFKPQQPIEVVTPAAISTTVLPESDVALVTIAKDGRVFFGVDNQNQRLKMVQAFNESYNLGLSPEQMQKFSWEASVGVPLNELKTFLSGLSPDQQGAGAEVEQPGIPIDSADGELRQWIRYTRNTTNSPAKLKFVIKADDNTKYKVVDRVLDIFKDESIHKLHLITSLKGIPVGTPAYETAQKSSSEE